MKIEIDMVLNRIENPDSRVTIVDFGLRYGSIPLHELAKKILTPYQFNKWAGEVQSTFILSKKKQQVLQQYIDKRK